MAKRLTEEMVIARTKISDLGKIKRLNCWYVQKTKNRIIIFSNSHKIYNLMSFTSPWLCLLLPFIFARLSQFQQVFFVFRGSELVDVSLLRKMPSVEVLSLR